MTDIADFLNARYDELEALYGDDRYHHTTMFDIISHQRKVIEYHKKWPVLVERPAKLEVLDDFDPTDINGYTMRMSREIMWATEERYIELFGTDPPTAPVLRLMAQPFSYHDDFQPDWLMES